MKKNHISDLLSTICQYNNVSITQTFTQDGNDLFSVRCVPNTTTLELTFLENGKIEHYESIEEAVAFIDKHINRSKIT